MTLPATQQLRYLVALADTLHFGQAADECGVSQPALSAQIARLEADLDARLVERTTRRVLLTPTGEEVVARARRALAELAEIRELARSDREPLSGRLRLGVIPTIAPYYLPPLLPGVRAAFPELQLLLREEQTPRLVESLAAGRIDAALIALPVASDALTSVEVGSEEFVLAVPAAHPLASRSSVVHADLSGEEVLLLEDGHCLRDQALAVCDLAGAREAEAIRATSISTLVQMVANGLGVTLLPESAAPHELRGGDVVGLRFADVAPTRTIGLATRKSSPHERDTALLAAHLRSYKPPT